MIQCRGYYQLAEDALIRVLELPDKSYNMSKQECIRTQTHLRTTCNKDIKAQAMLLIDSQEYNNTWLQAVNKLTRYH